VHSKFFVWYSLVHYSIAGSNSHKDKTQSQRQHGSKTKRKSSQKTKTRQNQAKKKRPKKKPSNRSETKPKIITIDATDASKTKPEIDNATPSVLSPLHKILPQSKAIQKVKEFKKSMKRKASKVKEFFQALSHLVDSDSDNVDDDIDSTNMRNDKPSLV